MRRNGNGAAGLTFQFRIDGICHLLTNICLTAGDPDLGTVTRHFFRYRLADPFTGTRDQCDLAGEIKQI